MLAARKIPSPELPTGAEITDPKSGTWQVKDADGAISDLGTYYLCTYCSYQTLCATTEPGRIEIATVRGE
jgi:hypothetical protein